MKQSSLVGHVLELFEIVDKNSHPPDRLTADFFRSRKYLGSHDRRFISDSLFGMIRHKRRLETLLWHYFTEHNDLSQLNYPHYKYLLLYVAYLIVLENLTDEQITAGVTARWKTIFPRIALQQFVAWIRQHQSLDFLPADEVIHLGVQYSFQDWMVKELLKQFAGETEELLKELNTPAPTVLRVNLLKTNRETCQQRLRSEGIETALTKYSPVGLVTEKRFPTQALLSFRDGWFEVQDEGSQLVSLIAAPKAGAIVIDACAGAGGKALHMAELMQNKGEIIALDIEQQRLDELNTRAARASVNIIRTFHRNAIQPEDLHDKADIVLVDAPCSGTGTIRRNPSLKWNVTESLAKYYAEQQLKILSDNSRWVKPGGRLVYATCSLLRIENENVVNSFLTDNRNFSLLSSQEKLKRLGILQDEFFVHLLPHHHRTDGFFVVQMQRSS